MTALKPLNLPALETLPRPRLVRRIAFALAGAFLSFGVGSLVVPWQQNVASVGRVTALDPLDRIQTIPAPVTGRLVRLLVQEGSYVEKGEVIAEMVDQDPDYAMRLEQQFVLTRDEVEAAKDVVAFYDQQLVHLEDAREQAISSATFALNVAIEKVTAEEKELEAIEADLEQKRADRERKANLWREGVVSELDYQKVEASYLSTSSKLEAARAKVEQARNDEQAKMADVREVAAAQRAKIESTKSLREEGRTKVALAERKLTEATTRVERQKNRVVKATHTGYVLRVHAANSADLLSQGEALIDLIPDTKQLAVELWARGVDAPLISPGRKVRLQFEGWPAVQFVGWPSVAVGTFGGVVAVVDAHARSDGRMRVLVVPDPEDEPWPNRQFLRQGARANGWVLLDTVTLGFEMWRQLNAFPPSIDPAEAEKSSKNAKSMGFKSKSSGDEKSEEATL